MATRTVTYKQLERALEHLGFTQTFRSGNHVTFVQNETGATILLPGGQPEDGVQPVYLYTARRTIVENGIADEETFELMLNDTSEQA